MIASKQKNFLLVLLFIGILPAGMIEASDKEKWCNDYEVRSDHPLAWHSLEPNVQQEIKNGQFEAAYWEVVEAYRWTYGDDLDEFKLFRAEVSEFLSQYRENEGLQPEQWLFVNSTPVGSDSGMVYLFSFLKTEPWVKVSCSSPEWGDNDSAKIGLFYAANAMQEISATYLDPAQRLASEVAYNSKIKLKNWIYNGLPMWPWEHFFNSPQNSGSLAAEPTARQWLVGRPGLNVLVNPKSNWESELDFALTFEVGHIWYLDKTNYDEWVGASLFTSFTDESGQGYGLMMRYNNYTFGAAHHESIDDNIIYFSIDLTQFFVDRSGKADLLTKYTTSD